MIQRYVCYYRVSTKEQAEGGYGLQAQRETVERYLNSNGDEIVAEYTEVESGGNNDRPELAKALRDCRLKRAKLIVSKLDRLSRDLHFITTLQKAGVPFVIAEMPEANELTISLLAALAQHERRLISQRTKDALAVVKAKGVQLGNPEILKGRQYNTDTTAARKARTTKANAFAQDLKPVIEELQAEDITSLKAIAKALNEQGFYTSTGKQWRPTSVRRLLERIGGRPC